MGRICIGSSVLAAIAALALSCGGGDCPDYPLRYAGTIDGSITADLTLNRVSSPAGQAAYEGMFAGKGASVGTNGVFGFRVDCSTHAIVSGTWNEQEPGIEQHGYTHGTATSAGAGGTWDCDPSAQNCTWSGSWDVARQ